jgi:hypothetical protein
VFSLARVKSVSIPDEHVHLIEEIEATGRSFSGVVLEALQIYKQFDVTDENIELLQEERLTKEMGIIDGQIDVLKIRKEILEKRIKLQRKRQKDIRAEISRKKEQDSVMEKLIQQEMKNIEDEYGDALTPEQQRVHAERRAQDRLGG